MRIGYAGPHLAPWVSKEMLAVFVRSQWLRWPSKASRLARRQLTARLISVQSSLSADEPWQGLEILEPRLLLSNVPGPGR